MVTIQLNYEGGLRCSAIHVPSGNALNTDAPVDNNGKGESFLQLIFLPPDSVPAWRQ